MPHTKTAETGNKVKFVLLWMDSELWRKPVLTYAISGNAVGGFGEFGEPSEQGSQRYRRQTDGPCRK